MFTLQVILEGKDRVWIFVRMSVVVQTKEVVGRLRRIIENSAVVPACPYTRCLHGCKCTTANIVAYSYNLRISCICVWEVVSEVFGAPHTLHMKMSVTQRPSAHFKEHFMATTAYPSLH